MIPCPSCGGQWHTEHMRLCKVHRRIECLGCANKHEGRTGP